MGEVRKRRSIAAGWRVKVEPGVREENGFLRSCWIYRQTGGPDC